MCLDRIDVVGTADDVGISELVEAVRCRGWISVRVYGGPKFRRAAAMLLQGLELPIAVADSPSERPTLSGLKPCAAFGAYSDDAARVFQR